MKKRHKNLSKPSSRRAVHEENLSQRICVRERSDIETCSKLQEEPIDYRAVCRNWVHAYPTIAGMKKPNASRISRLCFSWSGTLISGYLSREEEKEPVSWNRCISWSFSVHLFRNQTSNASRSSSCMSAPSICTWRGSLIEAPEMLRE